MKQWNLSTLIKNHKKDGMKWNYGKWMLNPFDDTQMIKKIMFLRKQRHIGTQPL